MLFADDQIGGLFCEGGSPGGLKNDDFPSRAHEKASMARVQSTDRKKERKQDRKEARQTERKKETSMIMMWIMTCSTMRKLRSVLAPAKDANPGTSKNKVHSIVRNMWLAPHEYPR